MFTITKTIVITIIFNLTATINHCIQKDDSKQNATMVQKCTAKTTISIEKKENLAILYFSRD